MCKYIVNTLFGFAQNGTKVALRGCTWISLIIVILWWGKPWWIRRPKSYCDVKACQGIAPSVSPSLKLTKRHFDFGSPQKLREDENLQSLGEKRLQTSNKTRKLFVTSCPKRRPLQPRYPLLPGFVQPLPGARLQSAQQLQRRRETPDPGAEASQMIDVWEGTNETQKAKMKPTKMNQNDV